MKRIIAYTLINSLFISTTLFASVPDWYLNVHSNSSEELLAVGSGKTIEEATNDALASIASQISVKVQSSLSRQETQQLGTDNQYKHSKNTTIKTNSTTGDVAFNNYKIIKSESLDGFVYVSLSINKTQWITEKLDKFREINTNIDRVYHGLDDKEVAQQTRDIIYVKNLIIKAQSLIDMIYSIDSTKIERSAYWSKYALYNRDMSEKLDDIVVLIAYTNTYFSVVSNALQNQFSKLKIQTVEQNIPENTKKKVLKIAISGDFKMEKSYGNFSITTNAMFQIKDKDSIVSSVTRNLSQQGQVDFKTTLNSFQDLVDQKIETDGIFAFLGLQ
jgi:hypothetical protein